MEYISTRNADKIFYFRDVFLSGLAPDGGLFIPRKIPKFKDSDLNKLKILSYNNLAEKIISQFCFDEFSKDEIKDLINNSYKEFRAKDVIKIKKFDKIHLLELFHGPTLAFKDIAMQVIGNMYEKILEKKNLKINIIVATSGDTGAAAISAIKNRKNINIFVLHPNKKISEIQRKFMTTVNSKNVFNIAVDGNFDDCQSIVKSMFLDNKFRKLTNLSGVNSINWARIIFQIVYYFFSYFQVASEKEKINFSVPTGNFGDIYAGYFAKKMGLPINKLIAATNENDILKRVINTGYYKPKKVQETISPSMDIQVASNFERLLFDVYLGDTKKIVNTMRKLKEEGEFKIEKEELNRINKDFASETLSDQETIKIIKEMYKNFNILVDPHTAVGIGALKKSNLKGKNIVLSTAHPFKFSQVVFESAKKEPSIPESLENSINVKEKYDTISCDLEKIKKYVLERL